MFLTKEIIQKNSRPHSVVKGGRIFTMKIGDYKLSIVGGCTGLYGDFENNFEVAVINDETGEFEDIFLNTSTDTVQGYSTIDDINEIISKIPR